MDLSYKDKVALVGVHLEWETLQWYQWFSQWEEFTKAMCVHFGPSELIGFTTSLMKLNQTTTIQDYLLQFEQVSNCATITDKTTLISPFHCRAGIWNVTFGANVSSILVVSDNWISLIASGETIGWSTSWVNNSQSASTIAPTNIHTAISGAVILNNIPIRKLTPTEMNTRREKGLCYSWNEKYTPGHKCKRQMLFLLDANTDDLVGEATPNDAELGDEQT